MMVLSLMSIVNVLRSRIMGNEVATISNVRILSLALQMYATGNQDYPDSLGSLSDAVPPYAPPSLTGGSGANGNPNLIGYQYAYTRTGTRAYTMTVNPTSPGFTGARAFFVDESGMIRHCTGAGPTDANDPVIDQPPTPC